MSTQGSEAGRWYIQIPPQTTRRLELRIICRQPSIQVDGKFVAGSDTEVTFNYVKAPEGDWGSKEPALSGSGYSNDVYDFLQAMVDEAAKHGIFPRGLDAKKELSAVREHLSDMRSLVTKFMDKQ